MPFPHALLILEHWRETPPENEMLAMLATVFTTWRPKRAPMTPEEHMRDLERRWASGEAMSPKQLFEATGGHLGLGGRGTDTGPDMDGIGPFPGHNPTKH